MDEVKAELKGCKWANPIDANRSYVRPADIYNIIGYTGWSFRCLNMETYAWTAIERKGHLFALPMDFPNDKYEFKVSRQSGNEDNAGNREESLPYVS